MTARIKRESMPEEEATVWIADFICAISESVLAGTDHWVHDSFITC